MTQSKKIILIVIFGVLANIGLFMNAGYFSHDEIGWGIKAISSSSIHDIKYYNIFNYNEFHYRPLNFNLWLLSSYYLFDTPQLFHLALLCCGMVNAALFYFIIRHFTFSCFREWMDRNNCRCILVDVLLYFVSPFFTFHFDICEKFK